MNDGGGDGQSSRCGMTDGGPSPDLRCWCSSPIILLFTSFKIQAISHTSKSLSIPYSLSFRLLLGNYIFNLWCSF